MNSLLRLHAVGEIPATYASLVLQRLEDAYVGMTILDEFCRMSPADLHINTRALQIHAQHSVWIPDSPIETQTLQLQRVVLRSPGFWEFLGSLNPLEVIRTYLNDRHQRQKDLLYRNRLEADKLFLENGLTHIKLLSDFMTVAERAGLDKRELHALLRDNAYIPLLRLNSLQDMHVISRAELNITDEADLHRSPTTLRAEAGTEEPRV